ncbi:unnamed protein product, partial [Scytosiphon promiscuus]
MIPPALGRLGALEKLELNGSKLIGRALEMPSAGRRAVWMGRRCAPSCSIPEELDGLSSLKELRLCSYGLSG